ncbi:MAG: hypothetical protein QOH61_1959 [Chloroflexota bacterium]|jgi:hypothetical protein|nr:hypothetical protein [Chloroflexota bacterium]
MIVRAGLVASLVLAILTPAAANAANPGEIRQVAITAPEGRLAMLVSPTPVIRTDASDSVAVVRIDNPSHLAERVQLRANDYVLDAAGLPQPAPAGYELGSASWYQFEEADFQLAPGTSRDIRISVVPPATAGAGDHSASLDVTVRAATPASATGEGASLETVLLVRERLEHRIPGAHPLTPDLRLDATVDGTTVHFAAAVTNPGNTVLSYQTAATLPTLQLFDTSPWADPSGAARTLDPRGYYVPPQSERLASFDWLDGPLLASYRAVYTLPPFDGLPAVTAETTFTVVNLPVLIGIALGALGLVALMIWATVRRRRSRRSAAA